MYVCFILDRLIDLKNENIAVREMRKHAAWYLKGIRGNGSVRNAVNECNTREELAELLYGLVEECRRSKQRDTSWIISVCKLPELIWQFF